MIKRIRMWLVFEGLLFVLASIIHNGYILSGYKHVQAGISEAIIAAVIGAGVVFSFVSVRYTRPIALGVQIFALLGTLVGGAMIALEEGPQTMPDRVFHIALIGLLLIGFAQMWRQRIVRRPRTVHERSWSHEVR